MSIPPPLMRVRIHSLVTSSRFLHVEDSLAIGKVRLFAGSYRRGEGLDQHTAHYLSLPDARVVFGALARGEPSFSYREQKGKITDGDALSRSLTIGVKGERVVIELKSGPGEPTPTGAVTPAGPATVAVGVGFKRYEARRLGAAVLAYLHAWDVLRMLAQRDAAGRPQPYVVVPATSDGLESRRETQPAAARQATDNAAPAAAGGSAPSKSGERLKLPAERRRLNGQALFPEKAAAVAYARQTAAALFAPANGRSLRSAPPLQYGDGAAVDLTNAAEVETFRQFLAEKRVAPASRSALQAYYRQRRAGR